MPGINNKRTRSAAAEDDGIDHIGYETPRSGVATPKPDLHDKRTPGILSMFGQVRPASFSQFFTSRTHTARGSTIPAPSPPIAPEDSRQDPVPEPNTSAVLHPVQAVPGNPSTDDKLALLFPHEMLTSCAAGKGPQAVVTTHHSYPTPPDSGRSSVYSSPSTSALNVSPGSHVTTAPTAPLPRQFLARSFSLFSRGHAMAASLLAPLPSMVTESSVPAYHISNPGGRAVTVPSSPMRAYTTSGPMHTTPSSEYASVMQLKKLTSMVGFKSGTSTPARAFSVAAPSQAESQSNVPSRETGQGPDRSATHTSTPAGTQAPAIKGKLTIKVSEGRGLKQCRDPYIVVSFQRNELESSGPHLPAEVDDDAAVHAVAMGGLPIQRQGSDSGRPAMAIPMRSRQSSNTSIHDFQTFRNRNARRSFTNPKWDAEAIL